jgi:conjugal transfer pilus assembly protein TraB
MSDARKKQQWKVISLLGAAGVTLFLILGWIMNNSQSELVGADTEQNVDPTIISDVTSSASPELSWIAQSKAQIEQLTTQVKELNNTVASQKDQQAQQIAELTSQYDQAILAQQQEINTLKGIPADGEATPQDPSLGQDFVNGAVSGALADPQSSTAPARPAAPQRSAFGQSFTLASNPTNAAGVASVNAGGVVVEGSVPPGPGGTPEDGHTDYGSSNVRKLSSYVPAGSYAPATVISGVDASAGVKSQENPVPVLLRLTGPAVTAALGAGAGRRIDLTGCTVVGSAAADLSAERVYVRLTTMTCVNSRGEVLETPVAGIVVGSGKAGVRGKVVTREGSLVRNAAIAGVLQGIGQTASNSAQNVAGADTLDNTVSSIAGASASGAIGGGITGAANTLAEYYISRAEQYQPVVSLYAATDVEVVFIDGVDLR